jgi:hypothetical protein
VIWLSNLKITNMKAIIITTSGTVPPVYIGFSDDAAPLLKGTIKIPLNADTADDMVAGDIEEHSGVNLYLDRAFNLGRKLV